MLQQAPVLSQSLEEDEMGFWRKMGWPGVSLACKSAFQFAKAHIGSSCVTSGFRACNIQLGSVKDVDIQLIGIFLSSCSATLHRMSENMPYHATEV